MVLFQRTEEINRGHIFEDGNVGILEWKDPLGLRGCGFFHVENGKIKIIEQKSQYNIIKDYMAERTYDESGDYTVEPFNVSVNNSLNDRLGNNGLFFNTETTEQKNSPSENLMCLKISPGKAYVRGYDIEKISTTIIDIDKPRDTARVDNVNVPFEMGNVLRVNTVSGTPKQKLTIDLLDQFVGSGTTIGNARVYNFSLTDASYTNNATNWNLYLYDIQTYTTVGLNTSVTSVELPATSFVKGKSSGASGFAVSAGGASSTINLRQTSGTFSVGEQLIINGIDFPEICIDFIGLITGMGFKFGIDRFTMHDVSLNLLKRIKPHYIKI